MSRVARSKMDILGEEGYAYSFDRQMYVNRKAKKAFSIEFVQDHSENEILKHIREHTGRQEWRFYFNSRPPDSVRRELESVLG